MSTVDVSVKCSKELIELGEGVAKFIGAVKAAVADGWQMGQDLPTVLSAAMGDLVPALAGVEKIPAELAEDKAAFVNASVVTGAAILAAVSK